MCTVTFIPVNNTVFITHNRDEKKLRAKAMFPSLATINGTDMIFPKDCQAGGSWAGMNAHGNAAVLLNGAFKNHFPQPPYRISRGLIFLELLAARNMLSTYRKINLEKIEPFTVILWNGIELFECRWDGKEKNIKSLDPARGHIWSSSTLYDDIMIKKRLSWFAEWKHDHPVPNLDDIIRFHREGGDGDESNDLLMNRDDLLSTVSITSMEITTLAGKMKYIDLSDYNTSTLALTFKKAVVESQ